MKRTCPRPGRTSTALDAAGDIALEAVAQHGAGDVVAAPRGDAEAEDDEDAAPHEQPPGDAAQRASPSPANGGRADDRRQPLARPRQHEIEDDAEPERGGRPQAGPARVRRAASPRPRLPTAGTASGQAVPTGSAAVATAASCPVAAAGSGSIVCARHARARPPPTDHWTNPAWAQRPKIRARSPPAPVVTRFAPSPTGFLHIGGARTALFNLLYARRHGGKFLLRIEDTDRARSTQAAVDAILDGMRWLGLDWDGEPVMQFARAARHAEVAHALLAAGHAYKCFATADELEAMRAAQRAAKAPMRYDGRWRDRDPADGGDAPFVVRFRAPATGETTIADRVQGNVTVANAELDDMVLLRSDGSPTYMLAVVVDDHDMGVTHVIRGDDHLNNAFRQLALIRALDATEGGWDEPVYAHIPLIHGSDGAKLSKRHGALGVDAYRDELGMLPEAVDNYLLKLGWGHGDDEFISRDQAIEWFDLGGIGRGPARFDLKKLEHVNGHYLRLADDARLVDLIAPRVTARIGRRADRRRSRPAAPRHGRAQAARDRPEYACRNHRCSIWPPARSRWTQVHKNC